MVICFISFSFEVQFYNVYKCLHMIFSLSLSRYASNADYMSTDDLLLFLEAEQGVGN